MTTKETLSFCVDDFKKWRTENYTEEQILSNATDDPSYPLWNKVEIFFTDLLERKEISNLDREDKINILYLIARGYDNAAFLSELIEDRPISTLGDLTDEDFIELAEISADLVGEEYDDAKSSIAMCFRKFEYLSKEIEDVLLKLYQDKNEYTKRMALFALAKLGYKGITDLVEKSWSIEDEWHKIGCLHVLDKYVKDEALIEKYLSSASNFIGKDLSEFVLELKEKNN